MSDATHPKKPTDTSFDEKTTIMTDKDAPITINLNIDDDVIDENYSFDQATVVQTSVPKATPPPLTPPPLRAAPSVPPQAVAPPPVTPPPPPVAKAAPLPVTPPPVPRAPAVPPAIPKVEVTAAMPEHTVTTKTDLLRAKGAVKIEAPVALKDRVKVPPQVQEFVKNKPALAAASAFVAIVIVFGVWKSHQPRQLDLHLDESSTAQKAPAETPPTTAPDSSTSEQLADRFEAAFQKVQADSGDVSR